MIDWEKLTAEERPQARRVAKWFADQHHGSSVLDVGCGPGLYVEEMQALGIDAYGVDNDPRLVEADHLWRADLLKMPTTGTCDIVLSLEVGEHLFESKSKRFVWTLTNQAENYIYFSAAPPGQGGDGHVNCQPKAYWIERFASFGWGLDQARTDDWLSFMTAGPHMGWIRNGMVFSR